MEPPRFPRSCILDENRVPIEEPDLKTYVNWWTKAHETGAFRVGLDEFDEGSVSTVLLPGATYRHDGKNHGFFETMMVVDFPMAGYDAIEAFRKYDTWAEAEAGHAESVAKLKGLIANMKANKPSTP